MGDQCLINIKTWSEYIILYTTEVATDVTDFDNEQKCYLCILTQATIKCAFLRDKKVILLSLILWGNQNRFLDLKQYHSLEHAETKKYIFLFRYLLC